MRRTSTADHRSSLAAGVALALCPCLHGAVISVDGVVSTRVQEQLAGEPGSINTDAAALSDPGAAFPLTAASGLSSTDLSGEVISLGEGLSRLADPARLDQANPEEFGVEAACYANEESRSYIVTAEAVETRTVLFTTPGNPLAEPEIAFGPDGTREIQSRVFLSGAILLWSTNPGTSLNDLLSEATVTITEGETGAVLFTAAVRISGVDNAIGTPTTSGPLVVQEVSLAELADFGLDAESLSALQSVAEVGALTVFVIPQQEHPYRYTVTADEPLDLVANLMVEVRNAPSRTGVAAAWGRPFTNLTEFIQRGLAGVDPDALQRALNAAIVADAPDSGSNDVRQPLLPWRTACGAFGTTGWLMSAGLVLLLRGSRSIHRRP